MLRDRKFLNGLGIGLVVGAILLELMNQSAVMSLPETDNQPPVSISDTGLSPSSKPAEEDSVAERKYTQAEVDSLIQRKLAEAAAAKSPQPPPSPQSQPQSDSSEPADSPTDAMQGRTTAMFISEGLSATEIAELLFRSEVITDREQFLMLLDSRNMNRRIQRGYFEFHGHPELEEIVDQITTVLP
jgi:hypothetical protein